MSAKPPSHLKSRRQIKIWEEQQKQNAAKRQKMDSYVNQNPFRYAERNFKARNIPDSIMSKVIDTSELLNNKESTMDKFSNIQHTTLTQDLRQSSPNLFGKADDQWRHRTLDAYLLSDIPGLIIIPNPFTPEAQRRLIKHCLTNYALPPNTSSLDAHYDRPVSGIWDLYKREQQGVLTTDDDDYYVLPRKAQAVPLEDSSFYGGDGGGGGDNDDYKKPVNSTLPRLTPSELLRKQRWVTLGYQYDWKTKVYDLEHGLPMPKELDEMAKTVVSAVEGIGSDAALSWKNTYPGSSFKAEAGVINYYQLRDTLMAHVDKSEVNMDAPLVSVSFGHASIYLIGGSSKDTAPTPICLRSGDLLIMSGSSRKSYHGVPRILENTLPPYLSSEQDEHGADWKLYGDYMASARINLNIRQVFPS
ncbi:hypothetical protein BCR42DRAFT_342045 [Absidia repens]|uniref:Fe2OG dioxygenase domain-containing protein n=1 Tax=Absidia repens TaxID=90262 RepID=A0A1X2IXJ7_9FUNG|nr:hypothetical protein BCR42DRAFT_342045 [Absidia repens]